MSKNVAIIGGGLSGFLTALVVKEKRPDFNVIILEAKDFPKKNIGTILLPPVARQLLHSIGLYEKFKYNEGRNLIYSLVNRKYDISFGVEDTAIINYSVLLQVLYQVAEVNYIQVCQNTPVEFIETGCISLSNGTKQYTDEIIIATGMADIVQKKYSYIVDIPIDGDMLEYPIAINDIKYSNDADKRYAIHAPILDNLPRYTELIRVGDAGGYVDFYTPQNIVYCLISCIYAGECISGDMTGLDFFAMMAPLLSEIETSLKLVNENKMILSSNLKDILFGRAKYTDMLSATYPLKH